MILSCILAIKTRWKEHKILCRILIVFLIFFLILWIRNIYKYIQNRLNNETQEWINIEEFSNILELDKVWKLQSYPTVTLLSDVDWEIVSMNVSTWDMVDEYDILMQIKNIDWISSDYDDVDEMINVMYDNYKELDEEYNNFQLEYWDKIKNLEKQLFNDQNALIQAIELGDLEGRKILEDEIEDLSIELRLLKAQQEDLEFWVKDLEAEIQLVRNESDKYYYELEKQTPRAPFKWVVWNIYIWEWESVHNWDELITIINNNYTPEISVSLDFNEFVLTKDLTWVTVILENENWWNSYYNWEIYTRSPILNDEWKYTVTVKITEEVSDLILGDDNSKITVVFDINSQSEWIPDNCFKNIWNNSWVLTLRDWDIIVDKEVPIKSKWNWWNNIELKLYSLEKEEEINWIQLCVDDWNNWVIKENDVDVVDWYNEFNSVEEFCEEFIKVNPMYWENRNLAIVSTLWWSWDLIELLCYIK